MRQAKERQKRTKDTQSTRHVKRILALADLVRGVLDNHGEDVCAYERANFAHGGCGAVVLTADGRGAGLGCTETDVVAGADFAHGEEDTVIRVVSAKWDKWGWIGDGLTRRQRQRRPRSEGYPGRDSIRS